MEKGFMDKNELYIKYKDYTVKIIIVLSFFMMNLYLIFYHEIWRDEAQAWLLARDCSLPQLFSMMKSEGHPCLWHLILMPFAKLKFSVAAMNVISCVITAAGVGIVVFKAPFGYIYKILIAVLCTYVIAVVSRSYCLAVPLLALLGCYYPIRNQKKIQYSVLLLFVSQIHLIFQGLAVALVLIALYDAIKDKNKSFYTFMPFAAGMLGIVLFVIQLAGCKSNLIGALLQDGLRVPVRIYRSSHIIFTNLSQGAGISITVPMISVLVLLFISLLFSVKKYYREIVIFLFTFGAQLVVNSYVFLSSTQRSVCTVLCLMFFSWIMTARKSEETEPKFTDVFAINAPKYIVAILCVGFIFGLPGRIDADMTRPYSDAKMIAEKISDLGEDNVVIITADDAAASSVAAYLDRSYTFYSLSQRKQFTFVDWRDDFYVPSDIEYINRVIDEDLSGYEHIYYLSLNDNVTEGVIQDNSSIMFVSDYSAITDEKMFLYRIK